MFIFTINFVIIIIGDIMLTINKVFTFEHIINKSTFICTLFPIQNLEEANNILKEMRKKYYDATHNCYACIYGENGEYAKNSDDGEPSQTAGIVIYDVLKKNNLTNVLAVVTRYFGGIKLGAGGLVRAYSSSTAEAVKIAELVRIEKKSNLFITVSYNNFNVLTKILNESWIKNKIFNESITIDCEIPTDELDSFLEKAKDITKNQIQIEIK